MSEIRQANPHLGWALWVSEVWYSFAALTPCKRQRLHAKARGIVLYDRVLNDEAGRVLERYLGVA